MRKLALGLSVLALIVTGTIIIRMMSEVDRMYEPRTEKIAVHEQTVSGAAQWFAERRVNLESGNIDVKDMENAKRQIAELRQNKGGLGLQWEYLGPDNIGGRCRAILIDPQNPNIMYAGGVSGGLWKSETAGGSWRQIIYEGDEETNGIPNLNISNMCMAANGDIYFGTGEAFYIGQGTGSRGFEGAGIWKSTDGENFHRLTSTWSSSESKNTFVYVAKLAAHPTNDQKIFAATNRGIRVTEDGGLTWSNPVINTVTNLPINEFAGDVKISTDGNILIARVGVHSYVSHQGGASGTWDRISGTAAGQIPMAARIEFAIAPTNSNIMYGQASKGDGTLLNVYKSEDAGLTWTIIGPGGSSEFNPLGDQGTFNNTIKVFPDNADELILGGQFSVWTWGKNLGWEKKSFWNLSPSSLYYVHADQHEIRFHPTDPNTIFVGSDGGVSRSINRGQTWQTRNKFFGITQFYAIGFGPKGSVIGGTQDNGTLYYDVFRTPNQGMRYEYHEVSGGDGGYSEISQINPDIMFSTVYYGSLYRNRFRGEREATETFYSTRLRNAVAPGDRNRGHSFITPIALWESFYDENSIDSVYYTPTMDLSAGTTVEFESNISGVFYDVVLEEDIEEGQTIAHHDTYQSRLVVGFRGSVWMSNKPMSVRSAPIWLPVLQLPDSDGYYEVVQHMRWSSDGDVLYVAVTNHSGVGTAGSSLYRVKGFYENRIDSLLDFDKPSYNLEYAKIAVFNNRIITGLAVDPEFAGNVVITLGNYGNTAYVYHSMTANADPAVSSGIGNFVNKQGNLPQMPVYDALILWNDARKVIVGTEFGVYSTLDITAAQPVWYDENEKFDYVATFSLRQQTHRSGWIHELNKDSGVRNHGHIWAGTHGRGIWTTKQFEGPVNIEPHTAMIKEVHNSINTFPNPATDYVNFEIELTKKSNVQIQIFDMTGKLVRAMQFNNILEGKTLKQINVNDLKAGVYVVKMKVENNILSSRFIVK